MTLRVIAVLALLLLSLTGWLSASEKSPAPVEGSPIEAASQQLKTGEAKGNLIKNRTVELKYAYARRVKVQGQPMYSLVLTDRPYSEDILKKGDSLSDAVGFKDKLHFVISTEGKIVTMNFLLSPPGLSTSKAYASANRKSVTIGADSIEGELAEEDSDFEKWSYRVRFKSTILKE
ncbi:MAG: hypothetical protein AABO41_27960 [Acidobacteriota bacterium]